MDITGVNSSGHFLGEFKWTLFPLIGDFQIEKSGSQITNNYINNKNGLVSGRLACTSSKAEILNKIGI